MKWQYVAIQMAVTFIAVFVAARVLVPSPELSFRIDDLEQNLSFRIDDLEQRLNNIAITDVKGDVNKSDFNHTKEFLKNIDSRLLKIEERISEDERNIRPGRNILEELSVPPAEMRSTPPRSTGIQAPAGWMSELSVEQRDQVALIFKEHVERLRELIPRTEEGTISFNAETIEAFEQQREELKEKLRQVLDEDQYEKFVRSLPTR